MKQEFRSPYLNDECMECLISLASKQRVPEDACLVEEGQPMESLFMVIKGRFGVFHADLGKQSIAMLGPGDLIGEASFLRETAATETVRALKNSTVLVVPHVDLEQKLDSDLALTAWFYLGLAESLERRQQHQSLRVTPRIASTFSPSRCRASHSAPRISRYRVRMRPARPVVNRML
jgi:CRP-like cAMP-binding protein